MKPTFIEVHGTSIGTANTNVYTVPDGQTFLCKRMMVANNTAGAQTVTVKTNVANQDFLVAYSVPANSTMRMEMVEGHVFGAGEIIVCAANVANAIRVSRLSGILLTLPAAGPQLVAVGMGIAIAAAATPIYTVPAGKHFVLKRASVVNTGVAGHSLSVKTSTTNSELVSLLPLSAASGNKISLLDGLGFGPGEIIQMLASTAGNLRTSRLSGLLIDV